MHLYKNIASKSIYIYTFTQKEGLRTSWLLHSYCAVIFILDSVFKNVQVLSQTNKAVVNRS